MEVIVIEIVGMHHVSLTVTKLEECKYFYGEVLGLTEIERPAFGFPGAWYQIGDQQLHLLEYPEASTFRSRANIDTKDSHFAIRVKSYDAAVKVLQENNVPYFENTGTKSGFVQVFCTDPDNNLVELNIEKE